MNLKEGDFVKTCSILPEYDGRIGRVTQVSPAGWCILDVYYRNLTDINRSMSYAQWGPGEVEPYEPDEHEAAQLMLIELAR